MFKDMKVFLLIYVVSAVLVICVGSRVTNNVCKYISDYNTKNNNKNCRYNPDVDLSADHIPVFNHHISLAHTNYSNKTHTFCKPNINNNEPEIITRHKYPLETYNVTTEDGYILQVFRIPRGKDNVNSTVTSRQPIFLQHGLFVSSTVYVSSENESMAFLLADNGYDVWLGNSRGSTYGKGHIHLSLDNVKYWNFSYHEMGVYDVPSSLDLVHNITGRNDIIYVGQSMGTNLAYVYAADKPNHAKQRIKLIISLAPTVFLVDIRTPSVLIAPFWPALQSLNKKLRLTEILPTTAPLKRIFFMMCVQSGYNVLFCETLLFLAFGFDYKNFRLEYLPVVLSHLPAGSSVNTVLHLLQGVMTQEFAHYDHGPYLNMKYYNSTKPPSYDLSRVTIPNFIIYGANDWVASEKGSYMLYKKLPNKIGIYRIPENSFNHVDFFFGKDIVYFYFDKFLSVTNMYKVDR